MTNEIADLIYYHEGMVKENPECECKGYTVNIISDDIVSTADCTFDMIENTLRICYGSLEPSIFGGIYNISKGVLESEIRGDLNIDKLDVLYSNMPMLVANGDGCVKLVNSYAELGEFTGQSAKLKRSIS